MSSLKPTLPSIRLLRDEVPTPGQRLGQLERPRYISSIIMPASRQNISTDSKGCGYIQGPLTYDQTHLLQGPLLGFTVLKYNSQGNNYTISKKRAQEARGDDGELCLSRGSQLHQTLFGRNPMEYKESLKAQGTSFQAFLPAVSMSRSFMPQIPYVIPFISADEMDTRLNLPGVSVARLLTKDQDILVNANSFLENPKLGSEIQVIRVDVIIKGYESRGRIITIPLECSHGLLTLLGLAYTISDSIYRVIHEGPMTDLDETNMRLVAIYSKDKQGSLWNVAYAIATV